MDEEEKTFLRVQTDVQIALATSLSLIAIAIPLVLIILQIEIIPAYNLPFNPGVKGAIILMLDIGVLMVGIGAWYFARKARQRRSLLK